MSSWRAVLGLILVAPCIAQQVVLKFDDAARRTAERLRNVLTEAHVSGSLVYSADCEFHVGRFPILPHVGTPRRSGQPAEVLQSMFGESSTIRVTQEPNGLVRMAEADVPTDILEVKIHHVSFAGSGTGPVGGARFAMIKILGSPEVRAFMEKHDLTTGAFRLEGANPSQPDVLGELNEVTVSEALDYVLKAIPGYWVYENCTTPEGARSVNFEFY